MHASLRFAFAALFASVFTSSASAQFNNPWATFVKDTQRIRNPDGSIATQVTADDVEKDYAFGDLDRDGWVDLVVGRKGRGDLNTRFPNQLLMNERGVLVDRTAQFAADASVPGDAGFLTQTPDSDVQVADLDGDGWPDIVTAANEAGSTAMPANQPRVYRNKGSIAGVWQGLRYEASRLPLFYPAGSSQPFPGRFHSVSVGDVTGDGFLDIYFTSRGNDVSYTWRLNDRLLINDGTGNFTDSLETRMTSIMLSSTVNMASRIIDMNGDGSLDVLKAAPHHPNGEVFVAYNSPTTPGFFTAYQSVLPGGSAYHVDAGDLNGDGRPDLVIGDDGLDVYRFNLGNANFGPRRPYTFLSGSDDGFVGNSRIVDLNDDGWPDTIHADVDVQIISCTNRCHVYHNLGGAIGGNIELREEIETAGAGGWKGAVGLLASELTGTFDVAPFDIDKDGDIDLVLGGCAGTTVWVNQLVAKATAFCLGDGSGAMCPCGNASSAIDREGCLNSIGSGGRLRTIGKASLTADTLGLFATQVPNGPALYFQGTWAQGVGAGSVFGDGLLCAGGTITRLGVVFASNGASQYPRPGMDPLISQQASLAPGAARTYQAWYRDADVMFCTPSTFNLTNGLAITWQ